MHLDKNKDKDKDKDKDKVLMGQEVQGAPAGPQVQVCPLMSTGAGRSGLHWPASMLLRTLRNTSANTLSKAWFT